MSLLVTIYLLVSLSTAEEASYLISNARHLRRSNNELVRKNIYINADLTPAEAKAAYELRCARRRQRTSVSQTRGSSSATNPTSHEANGEMQRAPTSSNLLPRSTPPLSVGAPVFQQSESVASPVPIA